VKITLGTDIPHLNIDSPGRKAIIISEEQKQKNAGKSQQV